MIHRHCPDIIVLDKGAKNPYIIDVAKPNGTNIASKVIEKMSNYHDLKILMALLFEMRAGSVKGIPVVIGALGSIPLKLCDLMLIAS